MSPAGPPPTIAIAFSSCGMGLALGGRPGAPRKSQDLLVKAAWPLEAVFSRGAAEKAADHSKGPTEHATRPALRCSPRARRLHLLRSLARPYRRSDLVER